ncbi:MAG: ABC transporter permease [Clostridia bacterium]|nr:ABC transporter permease [Clostridia bacterium]
MRVDSIALSSIRRRKWKMAFIVMGIVLAVGTVVALYSTTTTMQVELADRFDEIGANIMVVPKTDDLVLSYGGLTISGAGGDKAYLEYEDSVIKINNIKNAPSIATVAPKLLASLTVADRETVVVGVDFPFELRLKPWWSFDGNRPRGVDHVLLGADVANLLDLKPGDDIIVAEETFQVTAVLAPLGNEEDGLIFMQLLTVQRLSGLEDKVSLIEVAAYCTTCPIEEIVEDINHDLPAAVATAISEAVKARYEVIDSFARFAAAVAAVVVLIGSLVVTITMMSSVNERTREIGIFRSIGFRKSAIIEIVLTEALILGVMGGVLGYIVGILGAKWLAPTMAEMELAIQWNLMVGGLAVVGAIVLGIAASAYPALKAANLDPVEALRHI